MLPDVVVTGFILDLLWTKAGLLLSCSYQLMLRLYLGLFDGFTLQVAHFPADDGPLLPLLAPACEASWVLMVFLT